MNILISFTTSVGVVESLKVLENVAVDIVNQSIVLWLKNKKFPNPGRGLDQFINNRDPNGKTPPYFLGLPGQYAYITFKSSSYQYRFNRYDFNWSILREVTDEGGFRKDVWEYIFGGVVYNSGNTTTPSSSSNPTTFKLPESSYVVYVNTSYYQATDGSGGAMPWEILIRSGMTRVSVSFGD